MTTYEFKEVLFELGFERSKTLGVWGLSEKLYPYNSIKVCNFTRGYFWVEKEGRNIYTSNYREISLEEVVEVLMGIINKST